MSSYPWWDCVILCAGVCTGLVLLPVLVVSFFVSRILDLCSVSLRLFGFLVRSVVA